MSIIFVKKLFEPWGKVYFGNSPDVDRIRRILRGLHWGDLVSLAFLMFLSWTLIIMTGFLAVILARTILIRSAGGEKAECVNERCGLRCQQKQMLWCYPDRM